MDKTRLILENKSNSYADVRSKIIRKLLKMAEKLLNLIVKKIQLDSIAGT